MKDSLVNVRAPHKDAETLRQSKSRTIKFEELKLKSQTFKEFIRKSCMG